MWIIRTNKHTAAKPPRKRRVVVSVANDLVGDRRVDKVCSSLAAAGYAVLLVGCVKKRREPLRRAYDTWRFGLFFKKGFLFYAEFNVRLFFSLLFMRKDLLLCNDTDALPASFLASRLAHKPLVFDAHELFPETPEVTSRKFVKAFWTHIEDLFFPHLPYSYTVCRSIADYYGKKYGIRMEVVRNIPSMRVVCKVASGDGLDTGGRHLLLYQGAVNVGRGVEWIIRAMPLLDDCVLYICGDGDLLDEMKSLAASTGVSDRVIFTGRVPAEKLDIYTAQAEVGFVLLEHRGLSYYYSLPNRVFDYMKYGVPVLATDFPEIARIVANCNTGLLIGDNSPEKIAASVRTLLSSWNSDFVRDRIKSEALRFSWENEAETMLRVVARAIG